MLKRSPASRSTAGDLAHDADRLRAAAAPPPSDARQFGDDLDRRRFAERRVVSPARTAGAAVAARRRDPSSGSARRWRAEYRDRQTGVPRLIRLASIDDGGGTGRPSICAPPVTGRDQHAARRRTCSSVRDSCRGHPDHSRRAARFGSAGAAVNWSTVKSMSVPPRRRLTCRFACSACAPDGYHELRTIFQSIALHDTLTIRRRPRAVFAGLRRPEVSRWRQEPGLAGSRTGVEGAGRRGPPRDIADRACEADPDAGWSWRWQQRCGGGDPRAGFALGRQHHTMARRRRLRWAQTYRTSSRVERPRSRARRSALSACGAAGRMGDDRAPGLWGQHGGGVRLVGAARRCEPAPGVAGPVGGNRSSGWRRGAGNDLQAPVSRRHPQISRIAAALIGAGAFARGDVGQRLSRVRAVRPPRVGPEGREAARTRREDAGANARDAHTQPREISTTCGDCAASYTLTVCAAKSRPLLRSASSQFADRCSSTDGRPSRRTGWGVAKR